MSGRPADAEQVELQALAQAVAAEAVESGRRAEARERRRRRLRRPGMVMTGTALVLAGSVGAAAAVGWSARTGIFGEPGMTENDTSEWLYTGAGDYERVVRQLVPQDLPLPRGHQIDDLVAQQVEVGRREPAMVQETGVRGTAVFWAMCIWQQEWLEANASSDVSTARLAVEALRALPGRPELAAVDGGGVADRHRRLAESAAAGDRREIQRDVALNCGAWVR